MDSFGDLKLSTPLLNAINDLGFSSPTPIQEQAFSKVLSGKDIVGIAQTGTGKTFAYLLPIIQGLKFSKQRDPRVLILVPTRELVGQVLESIKQITPYITLSAYGVFGGVNINTQKRELEEKCDILVATPGRLYDLALSRAVNLKSIQKLVIDEVDVMLDQGFRFQINNIFELIPERRQNIMFSATMTEDVEFLIKEFFFQPETIAIAVSGTPLENIHQTCMPVQNFYTKLNALKVLLQDDEVYQKVLVFVDYKRNADKAFEILEETFGPQVGVIHANKTQNYRLETIENFASGQCRILITTDVMARGIDLEGISHVININTPIYPENYMHRIGRTGRAKSIGESLLMFTPKEVERKEAIESLMGMKIEQVPMPEDTQLESRKLPEERDRLVISKNRKTETDLSGGGAFHEKKDKNKKVNLGGSYHRKMAEKYKKPKSRGDKNANRRRKK